MLSVLNRTMRDNSTLNDLNVVIKYLNLDVDS